MKVPGQCPLVLLIKAVLMKVTPLEVDRVKR
jgi:hypothetical protein